MFSTSLVRVLGGLLPDSPPSPSMLPTTTTHLSQLEPHKGMDGEGGKEKSALPTNKTTSTQNLAWPPLKVSTTLARMSLDNKGLWEDN